jgi:transcriptional regulator with XRE-family HTH domain
MFYSETALVVTGDNRICRDSGEPVIQVIPVRIINRIQHYRLKAGYGQRELARLIGCDPPQLSKWENQRYNPSTANLQRLLHALRLKLPDLRLEDLLGTDDEQGDETGGGRET